MKKIFISVLLSVFMLGAVFAEKRSDNYAQNGISLRADIGGIFPELSIRKNDSFQADFGIQILSFGNGGIETFDLDNPFFSSSVDNETDDNAQDDEEESGFTYIMASLFAGWNIFPNDSRFQMAIGPSLIYLFSLENKSDMSVSALLLTTKMNHRLSDKFGLGYSFNFPILVSTKYEGSRDTLFFNGVEGYFASLVTGFCLGTVGLTYYF